MWALIEQTILGSALGYALWMGAYYVITGDLYEGTPEEDPIVKKAMEEGTEE